MFKIDVLCILYHLSRPSEGKKKKEKSVLLQRPPPSLLSRRFETVFKVYMQSNNTSLKKRYSFTLNAILLKNKVVGGEQEDFKENNEAPKLFLMLKRN